MLRGHGDWPSPRALVVSAAVGTVVLLVVVCALHFDWSVVHLADRQVLRSGHVIASASAPTVLVLKAVSALTVPYVYTIAVSSLATVLVSRGRSLSAVYLLVTCLVGLRIAPTLKDVVRRPRPDLTDPVAGAGGFSFPSGHTVAVTVVALATLLVLLPLVRSARARAWLVAAAVSAVLLVGTARLVLGVHFLTDVLAGAAAGAAWVAVSAAAWRSAVRAEWEWQRSWQWPHSSAVTPAEGSAPAA